METTSSSTLSHVVLIAAISTSVFGMQYDYSNSLASLVTADYSHELNVAEWKDHAFVDSSNYYSLNQSDDQNKIQTIIKFSKMILENSHDIDSEYIDLVNENFWDLI